MVRDLVNILMRSFQGVIFNQQLEGVVIALEIESIHTFYFIIHDRKIQKYWDKNPDPAVEISGSLSDWMEYGFAGNQGACSVTGSVFILQQLADNLEDYLFLLKNDIPSILFLRSLLHQIYKAIEDRRPPSPFMTNECLSGANNRVRKIYERLDRLEQRFSQGWAI